MTSIKGAEIIKHASNSFLATKISFINAVANICEKVGADINSVAEGIGLDKRINTHFLKAGAGFGGSCFPKDLKAFIHIAEKLGYPFDLLREVDRINETQKGLLVRKLGSVLWNIADKDIAVWGLAFKPDTDDIRSAPAIDIIKLLIAEGARVRTFDPAAMARAKEELGNEGITWCRDAYEAAEGADPMDQTSVSRPAAAPPDDRPASAGTAVRRVAFLGGDLGLDERTAAGYARMREAVEALGLETETVELATADYVVPAYYTIATAEASANLARYNGIRYGERPVYAENPEELVRKARSAGFGTEVKLRILLGTYVLRSGFQEQYYQRAQKVRTAIRRELDSLFSTHDLLVLPVFPVAAFGHGDGDLDAFQQKVADRFTTLANLAALPVLSIPAGVHGGLPVGIQAMAPAFGEERLFELAERISGLLPYERPPSFARTVAEERA